MVISDPFSFSSFDKKPKEPSRAQMGTVDIDPMPKPISNLDADYVSHYLRSLGILETVMVHSVDREKFLHEQDIKKLGEGAEGEVYFLRGHVIKVVNPQSAPALLREIGQLIYLNPIANDDVIGNRIRDDWPSLVWVYVLTDGGMSIGMRTFDHEDSDVRGSDLGQRLKEGPLMDREQAFRAIQSIAHSIAYCHNKGIIHHDLKPDNIWIPANPNRRPVVFDLGQTLWKQSRFGAQWWQHEFNQPYVYNGTYNYMHYDRRLAHLAAKKLMQKQEPSERQLKKLCDYKPTYYEDVFAFARILMDFAWSPKVGFTPKDRTSLRRYYKHLMGLRKESIGPPTGGSKVTRRLSAIFTLKKEDLEVKRISPEESFQSMAKVASVISEVIKRLMK